MTAKETFFERGLNSSIQCHRGEHGNCIMLGCSCACHRKNAAESLPAAPEQKCRHGYTVADQCPSCDPADFKSVSPSVPSELGIHGTAELPNSATEGDEPILAQLYEREAAKQRVLAVRADAYKGAYGEGIWWNNERGELVIIGRDWIDADSKIPAKIDPKCQCTHLHSEHWPARSGASGGCFKCHCSSFFVEPVVPVATKEKETDDIGLECLITRDTHRLLTETSEDFADRMRRQLIQERRLHFRVAEPKPTPSEEPLWVQEMAKEVDRQFALLPKWKQKGLIEIFANQLKPQPDSSSIPECICQPHVFGDDPTCPKHKHIYSQTRDSSSIPDHIVDAHEMVQRIGWEGIAGAIIDTVHLTPEDYVNEKLVEQLNRYFGKSSSISTEQTFEEMMAAVNWLMGCGEDGFVKPEGAPAYWWRTEFAKRAGLEYNGEKYAKGQSNGR